MGEFVEVRPLDEFLAALDTRTCVDELSFMPEMAAYCGRRFRVSGRADETCDRVHKSGLRRMHDTVHLEDLRCEGSAHDGCQAACPRYFMVIWLRRVDPAAPETSVPDPALFQKFVDRRSGSSALRMRLELAPAK